MLNLVTRNAGLAWFLQSAVADVHKGTVAGMTSIRPVMIMPANVVCSNCPADHQPTLISYLVMFCMERRVSVAGQRDLSSSKCVDAEGMPVDCCIWQTDVWVAPYMTLSNVTLLWSIFLVFELRVFTISGTIAQWYFSPPGLNSSQGTTMRSLRHALGASFGSLSLGSLVLTVVQLLRNAMEK